MLWQQNFVISLKKSKNEYQTKFICDFLTNEDACVQVYPLKTTGLFHHQVVVGSIVQDVTFGFSSSRPGFGPLPSGTAEPEQRLNWRRWARLGWDGFSCSQKIHKQIESSPPHPTPRHAQWFHETCLKPTPLPKPRHLIRIDKMRFLSVPKKMNMARDMGICRKAFAHGFVCVTSNQEWQTSSHFGRSFHYISVSSQHPAVLFPVVSKSSLSSPESASASSPKLLS